MNKLWYIVLATTLSIWTGSSDVKAKASSAVKNTLEAPFNASYCKSNSQKKTSEPQAVSREWTVFPYSHKWKYMEIFIKVAEDGYVLMYYSDCKEDSRQTIKAGFDNVYTQVGLILDEKFWKERPVAREKLLNALYNAGIWKFEVSVWWNRIVLFLHYKKDTDNIFGVISSKPLRSANASERWVYFIQADGILELYSELERLWLWRLSGGEKAAIQEMAKKMQISYLGKREVSSDQIPHIDYDVAKIEDTQSLFDFFSKYNDWTICDDFDLLPDVIMDKVIRRLSSQKIKLWIPLNKNDLSNFIRLKMNSEKCNTI